MTRCGVVWCGVVVSWCDVVMWGWGDGGDVGVCGVVWWLGGGVW